MHSLSLVLDPEYLLRVQHQRQAVHAQGSWENL